ncbi:MAG TPA: protein-methionine-sulfoxide reductase heme-binding subunit MsrQ [Steroidobacteraceae bacterium]|nr:protein-methionine-sulfoxide reductase heme-binding subunit MsrQ [Steroidobacteraceae bacterium]
MLSVEKRYRFVYKPAVFLACLTPALLLAAGAFNVLGQDLGPDPVNRLLHSCGKWTLNFIFITLAVTPLRQLAGFTHLARLRRMLGLFAFFYALCHLFVYVVLDQELNFPGLLQDIAKRPYITIGFTAVVLLVPLAVTSTNRMMRRLGRRWQKLHRLIYLIAVLGVVHYYWQVKRDVREPLLYAFILAGLLGYRVVWHWQARRRLTAKAGSTLTLRPSGSD